MAASETEMSKIIEREETETAEEAADEAENENRNLPGEITEEMVAAEKVVSSAGIKIDQSAISDRALELITRPNTVNEGIQTDNFALSESDADSLSELNRTARKSDDAFDASTGKSLSKEARINIGISLASFLVGGVLTSVIALIMYIETKKSSNSSPLPTDLNKAFKDLLDKWQGMDDSTFWASLSKTITTSKIPLLKTIPGQMLLMNMIMLLSDDSQKKDMYSSQNILNVVNSLINACKRNNYITQSMYMMASHTLKIDGKLLTRPVVAKLLQISLGNLLADLQDIPTEEAQAIDAYIKSATKGGKEFWQDFADLVNPSSSTGTSNNFSSLKDQLYFLQKKSVRKCEWNWDSPNDFQQRVDALFNIYQQYGNSYSEAYRQFCDDKMYKYKGVPIPDPIVAQLMYSMIDRSLCTDPTTPAEPPAPSSSTSPTTSSSSSALPPLARVGFFLSTPSAPTVPARMASSSVTPLDGLDDALQIASMLSFAVRGAAGPVLAALFTIGDMICKSFESGDSSNLIDLANYIVENIKQALTQMKLNDILETVAALFAGPNCISEKIRGIDEACGLSNNGTAIKLCRDLINALDTAVLGANSKENLFSTGIVFLEQQYQFPKGSTNIQDCNNALEPLHNLAAFCSYFLYAHYFLLFAYAKLYSLYSEAGYTNREKRYDTSPLASTEEVSNAWYGCYLNYITQLGYHSTSDKADDNPVSSIISSRYQELISCIESDMLNQQLEKYMPTKLMCMSEGEYHRIYLYFNSPLGIEQGPYGPFGSPNGRELYPGELPSAMACKRDYYFMLKADPVHQHEPFMVAIEQAVAQDSRKAKLTGKIQEFLTRLQNGLQSVANVTPSGIQPFNTTVKLPILVDLNVGSSGEKIETLNIRLSILGPGGASVVSDEYPVQSFCKGDGTLKIKIPKQELLEAGPASSIALLIAYRTNAFPPTVGFRNICLLKSDDLKLDSSADDYYLIDNSKLVLTPSTELSVHNTGPGTSVFFFSPVTTPEPLPTLPIGGSAIARYPYTATSGEQISFVQGEKLNIIEKLADGWWRCQSATKTGLVPSGYLEEIPLPSLDPTPLPSGP